MAQAAASPTKQLLEAYRLYQRAPADADAKIEAVRAVAGEVMGEVFVQLWSLKGSFERPSNGEKMFYGREGFSSSSAEKAAAIFAYLKGVEDADFKEEFSACKAPLLPKMMIGCYGRNSKGELVPVHFPGSEEDKIYKSTLSTTGKLVPCGQEYRWPHEGDEVFPHTTIFDDRAEVATTERPAKDASNSVAWRAVEGVDYEKLGYIKIGCLWVERSNSRDVAVAQEREIAERKPRTEVVAGGLALGLEWLEGTIRSAAGGAGSSIADFFAGIAASLHNHAAVTDREVKSEVFTKLTPGST